MAPIQLKRLARLAAAVSIGASAIGCAQAPKPLYHWGDFQGQLYEHFKAEGASPAEQLRIMEEQTQKAEGGGAALPPGFRAHLAMIYLRLGREGDARQQLEAEKARFPESAQYMDFLLKRMSAPKS
jgi:hypothetical protein